MTDDIILYRVEDHVAHLTFNRPDAANGMSLPFCQLLMQLITRADSDPNVRAMLVTGNGRMFSAGGDLKSFLAFGDAAPAKIREMTLYLHGAISRMQRMRAPVITAVHGPAAGAGMSFAAASDLVLAGESAHFTMAYTAVGLAPDGSSSWFLPRLIGHKRAMELMLTNRRLSAAEALEMGLITRVVADDELIAEAEKLAATIAAGPTEAYGSVKRLLIDSQNNSLETQMEQESRAIGAAAETADFAAGVQAFAEKRKPTFSGN